MNNACTVQKKINLKIIRNFGLSAQVYTKQMLLKLLVRFYISQYTPLEEFSQFTKCLTLEKDFKNFEVQSSF